jgi:archaemetzincin
VSVIALIAIGEVESGIMNLIRETVQEKLGTDVRQAPAMPDPDYAWDGRRRQYSSSVILRDILSNLPAGASKICAITEKDLFIPMLSFIYGQAQVDGQAAIVSLARLRQEFYGLPANPALLAARARKEALHELGHTFGLIHCPDAQCAMSLSTNIRQLDLKGNVYCADCRAMIVEKCV